MKKTNTIININRNPSWMPEGMRSREKDVEVAFRFSEAERKIYRKRKKILPSVWVKRHRVITMGAFKGKWRNELTPYLVGIMDASFFSSVEVITVCACDQAGKSECVNNCIGYGTDRYPGPVLCVYPDELTGKENMRDRILPMIKSSRRLKSYMTGVQDDESNVRIKLAHMPIYIAWARSAARLANKPIKYEVQDETDKYPDTAGLREAAPSRKAEMRLRTYMYSRKIWKTSTPTIESGPIWKALTEEAQVVFDFWVVCPDCGKSQRMVFEQIKWPEGGEADPKKVELEDLAYYECPHCGNHWKDYKRNAAVKWGQWRARKTDEGPNGIGEDKGGGLELFKYLEKYRPRRIGFHIPAWIVRFVPLSECAGAFLRGLKDKTELKHFNNSYAAVPWKHYAEERKEDKILLLRDDRPRGIVPGGGIVSAITAGVDTQDNGFFYKVRAWGWGMELESWGVREGFIDSFAALSEILWEEIYRDAEDNQYVVNLVVQDAMGHKTSEVYDFTKKHPGKIIAFQGVDTRRMAAPLSWSNIEFYPGTKKPIPGGLKLLRADVNYFKDILAGKLEISPTDPGAWYLHAETTEEYARHMCAEYIDEKKQIWACPESKANHYWDCEVMNLVAAEVLRVKYWKRPEDREPRREPEEKKEKGDGWIPKREGWMRR